MPVRNTMEKLLHLRIVEKYNVHKNEKSMGADVKLSSLNYASKTGLDGLVEICWALKLENQKKCVRMMCICPSVPNPSSREVKK